MTGPLFLAPPAPLAGPSPTPAQPAPQADDPSAAQALADALAELAQARRDLAIERARRIHGVPDDLADMFHGDDLAAFDGQAQRLARAARARSDAARAD